MARCTGVSDRMLRYRCNELHHLGYLRIYPRYNENGGQSSNYYDFAGLFARMEEILTEEGPLPNPIREGNALPVPADVGLPDSSFLARYGRVILSYGIAAVPRALFTHQKQLGLTAQQVWFICYILSFQWDTGLPYPSINKMAKRTGYSKQQIHAIKAELVEKGYLEIKRRAGEGGGNDTNMYDFSALFDAIRHQLEPGTLDEQEQSQDGNLDEDAGEDVEQGSPEAAASVKRRHRPRQPKHSRFAPAQEGPSSNVGMGAAMELTGPTATQLTRGGEIELAGGPATGFTIQVQRASSAPLNRSLPAGRKEALPEIEASKEETLHQDDSNQRSQKKQSELQATAAAITNYSPYIAGVASDFSRELGDMAHEASNIKQALNLWKNSELSEEEFVEFMNEARKLTRKYQSRPHWDTMTNKMAYWFAVLRDLVQQHTEDGDIRRS
jgi:hypothetical protein